jgi:tRNA A37 threonylcarbamoyladenosine biosynthesis protein TsaE
MGPSDGHQPDQLHAVVPVVVITGFLGSGKTTLVQHLLLNGQVVS